MDRSTPITLVTETYTTDSIGQRVASETSTTVFANVKSVTRAEFYSAGEGGIKPEYKVTMFEPDYSGQKIVIYNSTRYNVYRTYLAKGENIELYLEQRVGS